MEKYITQNGIKYELRGEQYYPMLEITEQEEHKIGKYGLLLRDYIKQHTDEQKEIFEKFHDCWSEYMSLGEAAIFEYAFKLGMQIAIETLTE